MLLLVGYGRPLENNYSRFKYSYYDYYSIKHFLKKSHYYSCACWKQTRHIAVAFVTSATGRDFKIPLSLLVFVWQS